MGGTEATLTRIADALDAYVMQHNRSDGWGRYLPVQPLAGIEHVVLNRDSRALPRVRELFPARAGVPVAARSVESRLHPRAAPGAHGRASCVSCAVTAVCVSDSQRRGVEATLRADRSRRRGARADDLQPDRRCPAPGWHAG